MSDAFLSTGCLFGVYCERAGGQLVHDLLCDVRHDAASSAHAPQPGLARHSAAWPDDSGDTHSSVSIRLTTVAHLLAVFRQQCFP